MMCSKCLYLFHRSTHFTYFQQFTLSLCFTVKSVMQNQLSLYNSILLNDLTVSLSPTLYLIAFIHRSRELFKGGFSMNHWQGINLVDWRRVTRSSISKKLSFIRQVGNCELPWRSSLLQAKEARLIQGAHLRAGPDQLHLLFLVTSAHPQIPLLSISSHVQPPSTNQPHSPPWHLERGTSPYALLTWVQHFTHCPCSTSDSSSAKDLCEWTTDPNCQLQTRRK